MSYQIEMLWQCYICRKAGNRGLKDRYCGNCGHKKDDSDNEYFPEDTSEKNALTGDLEVKAKAGEDWVCQFCESLQNQLNQCCSNCGATERGTKKLEESTHPFEQTSKGKALRMAFDEIDAEHKFSNEEYKSDAPVSKSISANNSLSDEDFSEYIRPNKTNKKYLLLLILIVIGLVLWFIFRTKEIDAKVSTVYWEHKVLIDRYKVLQRDGWVPELNSFEVYPVGLRHHHFDRVHVGSHLEPDTIRWACGENCTTSAEYTTCKSNKNGSATCTKHGGHKSCTTKYCTKPTTKRVDDYENVSRKQMWYVWKIWDWAYDRTITHSGSTKTPTWPTDLELRPSRISDGEKERNTKEEIYKVIFKDDEDSYTINPKTETEFLQYKIDDNYKLEVSIGSVKVIKQL